MRYAQIITKTSKEVSTELESVNAKLLTKAGFIRQQIAGVYNYLPLGLKVLNTIEAIVREEMDKIASEILMPALSEKQVWQQTGRLDTIDVLFKAIGGNKASVEKNDTEYVLGSTHEEIVTPLIKHYRSSYKDLPFAVYQIQTKFRNEPRAKSGLLRGREFRMKDLYSFHVSKDDLLDYYEKAKQAYTQVFKRLGIGNETYLTFASGGGFTDQYSHEYQTLLTGGEDMIYLDRKNKLAYNEEIKSAEHAKKLGIDFEELEPVKASEVGNIFPLETKYSKAFGYYFTDKNNQQQLVWMGCYGIGTSRLMGVLAEKFADDKGLVWPKNVAPFLVYLVRLDNSSASVKTADQLYLTLEDKGVSVLYDDRVVSAGEKFADADLLGIPYRIVVSEKTVKEGKVELKERSLDKIELVDPGAIFEKLPLS